MISVGNAIWSSVKPMFKIYLIIGVGFLLAKMSILTVETTRGISDIILTVLLPCLSFNKIVVNIEGNDIKSVGIICLSALLIFGTGLFFAYMVRKVLPVPKQWHNGILAGGMFPNISDLPIAYLQTMDKGLIFTKEEGEKGVACVIIFLAMFLICVFNFGGFRLIESDFEYSDEENVYLRGNNENHNHINFDEKFLDDRDVVRKQNNADEFLSICEEDEEDNGRDYTNRSTDDETEITSISPSSVISLPTTSGVSVLSPAITRNSEYNEMHNIITSPQAQPVAYTSPNTDYQDMLLRRRTRSDSLHTLRSIDLRQLPAQDINDVIKEYSNVDQYGHSRTSSVLSLPMNEMSSNHSNGSAIQKLKSSNLTLILTSDATVGKKDIDESGTCLPFNFQQIFVVRFLIFFIKNCFRPCSIAVILGLMIAFIPWLKALFTISKNTPNIAMAPDQQPILSFIMDFTEYVGAASVPFGLLLLGATLGRLKIGKLYPGFWKSALTLVILKLCVMPIFGVLWCDRLVKAGWVNWEDDNMLLFVIAISWGLPTMTTLIYFTASYTPPESMETTQMECVSFFLMIQYPIMVVSLPFLVTYFLKVQMKL